MHTIRIIHISFAALAFLTINIAMAGQDISEIQRFNAETVNKRFQRADRCRQTRRSKKLQRGTPRRSTTTIHARLRGFRLRCVWLR